MSGLGVAAKPLSDEQAARKRDQNNSTSCSAVS